MENLNTIKEKWMPILEKAFYSDDARAVDFRHEPNFDNFCSFEALIRELGGVFQVYTGETKGVLCCKDLGVVFKFPFLNRRIDFCRAEVRNYRAAKEAGLEDRFAWCDKFCTFPIKDGYYTIYIMEYAECDDDWMISHITETFDANHPNGEKEDNSWSTKRSEVESGTCEGVAYFLEDEWMDYNEFDSFCQLNDIDDIHSANLGIIDERLVVIDYSGYAMLLYDYDRPEDWFSRYGV